MDSPKQLAQELVKAVLEGLEIEANISVESDSDGIRISIDSESEDLGLLIGKQGRTLEALQHLTYQSALRSGEAPRITVDVDGYRERREAYIREEADRAADEVAEFGGEVELEPMSASERRVAHEHLRDREGISTTSRGSEPSRFLVVIPSDG